MVSECMKSRQPLRLGEVNSADYPARTNNDIYFLPADLKLLLASTGTGLATTTAIKCKNVKLMWEPLGFKGYSATDTTGFAVIAWDRFRVMIEATTVMDKNTYRNLWLNDTNYAARIVADGDHSLGSIPNIYTHQDNS